MCLAKIEEEFEPTDKIGVGYRVYEKGGNTYYSPYMNFKLLKGIWYTAHQIFESAHDGKIYKTGFHILTNLEEAKKYQNIVNIGHRHTILVKVKYSQARIKAKDGTFGALSSCLTADCIIADKIKILGEIDDEGNLK